MNSIGSQSQLILGSHQVKCKLTSYWIQKPKYLYKSDLIRVYCRCEVGIQMEDIEMQHIKYEKELAGGKYM